MDEEMLRRILNETLDEKLKPIHNEIKEIKESIQEVESVNANRHIELMDSIKDIKDNLNTVEMVTSKNWNEITKLKSIK